MRPETKTWLDDAAYDLESAEAMLTAGRWFFVLFMCHLTIEKLLKAVIVERTDDLPPKIHNLIALAVRAGLEPPPERESIVNELDNMGVVTRYPDGRRIISTTLDKERVGRIYRETAEFMQWLKTQMA